MRVKVLWVCRDYIFGTAVGW